MGAERSGTDDETGATDALTGNQGQDGAATVFGGGRETVEPAVDLKELRAKTAELTLQNDFWAGALGKAGLLSAKR